MQRRLFIDKNRCVGCYACVVACKSEHGLGPHPTSPPVSHPSGPDLIRVHRIGPEVCGDRILQCFVPTTCMHCHDAPCIKACPQDALYGDVEAGIVRVDEMMCIGCESCLSVCPFDAPQFFDGKLKLCDLCIHRQKEGRSGTACEAVCQAKAIFVGDTRI